MNPEALAIEAVIAGLQAMPQLLAAAAALKQSATASPQALANLDAAVAAARTAALVDVNAAIQALDPGAPGV